MSVGRTFSIFFVDPGGRKGGKVLPFEGQLGLSLFFH